MSEARTTQPLKALLERAAEFVHEIYNVRRSDLKKGSDLPFGLADYYDMEDLEKALRDAAAVEWRTMEAPR